MTWAGWATHHIGHRVDLTGPYRLRCNDCSQTGEIPRDTPPVAPLPPKWQPAVEGTPMPADFREQYQAHRRRRADG